MADGAAAPLAELQEVWKSFSGVPVLRGVSVDVRAGEIHALVGGNGAGKSTLMRVLTGAVQPDSGRIVLQGTVVRRVTPASARREGISLVPQEPALFPNLSVLENITLGLDSGAATRREAIAAAVASLGHTIDLDQPAAALSISDQQLVEIARGVLRQCRVLVVDEPTAALTVRETAALFERLKSLAMRGLGIFYISHRLGEVFELCHRITVLRDGEVVLQAPTGEVSPDALMAAMVPASDVGRGRGAVSTAAHARAADRSDAPVAPRLSVQGLSGQGFRDVSFSIAPGEIVGLAGVVGSGRTELAETIFGLRPGRGSVELNGRPLAPRSPRRCLEHGLAYLPEDRHAHGIFLGATVIENISASVLGRLSPLRIRRRAERDLAARLCGELRLTGANIGQLAATLSGGNQQKVALGKCLAATPRVVILDEPSRGIDAQARLDLYAAVEELAAQGMGVLLISSDFEEIVRLSQRVLVMRRGVLGPQLMGDELTLSTLADAAFIGAPLGDAA